MQSAVTDSDIFIRETTQPTLSGHAVGVSNIWERELPDAQGRVTSRPAAQLSILDEATRQARTEFVAAGDVLTLGADRYQVVSVSEGRGAPGSIVLRSLAGPP